MKISTDDLIRPFFYTIVTLLILGPPDLFAQDQCLECHAESDLTTVGADGKEISLYVNADQFHQSVHGDFSCTDCHSDVTEIPHPEKLQKVDCGVCHDNASKKFELSIHAQALREGSPDAPSCHDCHGTHDILAPSNPGSRVNPLQVASTCAVCHANPQIVQKYHIPVANPLAAYEKSTHGVAVLSERNFDAATCVSCHGSHEILALGNPKSPIYWRNVPETCGNCHGDILDQYSDSVHWTSAKEGVREAPVCTDCHGEHEIQGPANPESPVNPLKVSSQTCGRCHGSELITQKFGVPGGRVSSFEESYHGLAVRGGSLRAANCASCHGIHSILPSSDPRSTIYPANLEKTCGHCHKDVTANFAKGPIHVTSSTTPGRVVYYVQNFYIGLIVLVIGAMVIHNGIDFVRRSKRKLSQRG